MKRHAPAAERNAEPIAVVLAEELPERGLLLEIAAGTGQHAVHFAREFPQLEWQPTDPDPDALASIAAWRAESELGNLRAPIELDVSTSNWPIENADAILCINMVHISPVTASEGLMAGAGRLLPEGAPLVLYGPFLEAEVETAPSNRDFDASLRARDPRWGLRDIAWMDRLAAPYGLVRTRRTLMPANNLMFVYRKCGA